MNDKSKKSKILKFWWVILIIFLAINLIWLIGTRLKYNRYNKSFKSINNKSYYLSDDDGYVYNIKYPDYLRTEGNLAVSSEDGSQSLIIWPLLNGKYEYGYQIKQGREIENIKLNDKFEAEDSYYQNLIEENNDKLEILKNKIYKMWNIR